MSKQLTQADIFAFFAKANENLAQIGKDGVSTNVPVGTTPVVTTPPATTVDTTAPGINVPRAIHAEMLTTVSQAINQTADSRKPTGNRTVDVGTKQYQSGLMSDLFVGIQPPLTSMMISAGGNATKANQLTNTVMSTVSDVLIAAGNKFHAERGTTALSPGEYSEFVKMVSTSAVVDVGKLIGSIPPASLLPSTDLVTTIPVYGLPGADVPPTYTPSGPTQNTPEFPIVRPNPTTPQQSPQSPNDASLSRARKVYLKSAIEFNSTDMVEFKGQPRIEVSEKAEYDITSPIHSPTGFASYKLSNLREISIAEIKLFSRTPEEATANMKDLQMLKSWTRPYFGKSRPVVGAPPDILYFYAYSGESGRNSGVMESPNFYRFPTVLTNLSYTYPNDVDYIPTLDGVPFPIVMTITIQLLETRSPNEVEEFNLQDYKMGNMISW